MADTQTATQKWTADSSLGKIQLKRFNDAVSKYNWEAKTIIERTDYGEHAVTPMFGGSPHPEAATMMQAIMERYNATVTAANYQSIISDIEDAKAELVATRRVDDRRSTQEQRDERERARIEREAKEAAEAARIATFVTHNYDVVEAAAALKRVLSVIWPTVKFSVKSEKYSGGYSVTPSWTDGPTGEQVSKITDWFSNKHFDGMNDLETTTDPSEWNGHRFNIRGGYVRGSRSVSADLMTRCMVRFVTETGLLAPSINTTDPKYPYIERTGSPCGFSLHVNDREESTGLICRDDCSNWTAAGIVEQMTHHLPTVEPAYPLERETVFRILLGEIGAPAVNSEIGENTQGVVVSQNEEKDGVEIRFADKPAPAVLDRLKAAGWRWSRFSKVWWHKRTPAALAFAASLAGTEGAC